MKKSILLFTLLFLTIGSASARLLSVRATLNGTNEVPANASTAKGTVVGTFDDISLQLNLTITFTGLSANALAAHIHKAAVGLNGGVVIGFSGVPATTSGTFNYTGTLSNLQATDLLAGLYYVNVHNSAFPGGEIRGQLRVSELETFTSANINDFYAIGGYSYLEGDFPVSLTLLTSPYVRSGPLPNNDFTFVATSPLNLAGRDGRLTTNTANQAITLTFKGNNVRKMRAFVRSEDVSAITTSGTIIATATTNLGNSANEVGSGNSPSVGFRVLNENEYIVQVVFSAPSDGQFTTLDNIMIGDDTPQNVALSFDGVNDNVALPSTVGNFASNATFTVSCWVKPAVLQSDLINTDVAILEKWDGTGTAYPFVIRYLNENITNFNAGNVGKIVAARYNGIANPSIMSSVSIDDNKWHHIAFVVDALGMKLYIDGVLSASGNDFTPQQANTPCTNSSPLYVGSRNNINHFFGEIDEVRLWDVAKTATEIQDERFCKNPNTASLQASYNFNNGVPNGNNILISQIRDAVGSNHGVFSPVFAKTGEVSNFVTGQVKYVKANAPNFPQDGNSWATASVNLQLALTSPNACNDLFDVYVAAGTYLPSPNNNPNISFNIPSGMKIYGGFQGYENSINERNMALIHSSNSSILSGDLLNNDTPFNFTTNRTDNSLYIVQITGNNTLLDGFTMKGSSELGRGLSIQQFSTGSLIKNSRFIDNGYGLYNLGENNLNVSNCSFLGNNKNGIFSFSATLNITNSLFANNVRTGFLTNMNSGNRQISLTNCTLAANGVAGIGIVNMDVANITTAIKNTISYSNISGGILIDGVVNTSISHSLIQGQTSTANGNLDGNTVNPQFVNPLAAGLSGLSLSNLGDYRLKWCSLAINAGDNTGISPLDLDRNPRNFNATADMGAYEFLGNTPSQVNNSTISGTLDMPIYQGGAIQTITSDAKVLAPARAIDFKAPNSITLNPGFEARGVGKYFKAEIGANVGCLNP